MKLMLIATEFPPGPGGIGTHAYYLATHLQRQGWQICVVTSQSYVTPEEKILFNREQVFSVIPLPDGFKGRLQRFFFLRKMGLAFQPDILVSTGSRALWSAALLAPRLHMPHVAVAHGSEFLVSSRWRRWLTCWSAKQATKVVAVSEFTAEIVRSVGVASTKLAVIPNGADEERFRPGLDSSDLRQALGLHGRRVLLTVGHVSERKAQDIVIRALPDIIKTQPDVVYVMVGLPAKQSEWEKLAHEIGVSDHIVFAGVASDEMLPLFYNMADIFVLVSRFAADGTVEGYGIVVLEAALCGVPAIVSNAFGLREAVCDGETGLTVPPEDVLATATAVKQLLQNEPLRQSLGQQALQRASLGTWSKRMSDYNLLLRRLVNN